MGAFFAFAFDGAFRAETRGVARAEGTEPATPAGFFFRSRAFGFEDEPSAAFEEALEGGMISPRGPNDCGPAGLHVHVHRL